MSAQKLEKIGRYQVLDRVGKGGMGVLYRGFDPVLDREVAIKLMHADFSEDTEQMRPRFYREARAAAKLNHRNIVTIFEFAEESNIPYIVMEFLRGTPLGARLNAQPPLTLVDKLNSFITPDNVRVGKVVQSAPLPSSPGSPPPGAPSSGRHPG